MPRPARRTRAVESRTASAAASAASNEPAATATSTTATLAKQSAPVGTSSNNEGRRRTRRSDVSVSSDVHGTNNREGSRRTSLRQAAATTAAAARRNPSATRPARGPDASGLDILDDDAFGGMDTTFGEHDLDLDDLDVFGGLNSPSPTGAAAAPGSANATRSTDNTSSLFNVGLFRRGRPRQSSVHSRDDAPIRPSSRGGAATPSLSSTFSLGTFKRRAREPSILGRNRRQDSSRHTSRDRDTSEASGSEMDRAPYPSDGESSSMARRTRRGSTNTGSARVSQVSHIAQAAQSAHDSSVASASNTTSMLLLARTRSKAANAKKRKSEEAQHSDEPPKRRATEAAAALPSSDDDVVLPSVEAASSSPLSTPPQPASLPMSDADRRRYATPGGPDDEVMAPPMSSGSESASPPMWPSLKTLTHGARRGKTVPLAAVSTVPLSRRTPELINDDDDASDISSPPSLTHSPNYRRPPSRAATAKARAKPRQKDVVPLTTAALTALLPQRRHRARGALSDESEDEDELERSALLSEDDDKLAHGSRRAGLRRGRSASRPSHASRAPSASAPKVTSSNRQPPAAAARASRQPKKPVKRTYGSRSFSDKENQDADGSTFSPLPDDAFEDETTELPQTERGRKEARYFGEELEKAAKKFKEVDKWTLEFESVSRESSPIGAR